LTYEAFHRKGDHRERKARVEQLESQLAERIALAQAASVLADRLNTVESHCDAASAWRRIIYPATRLDQDATIYRDAVRRHTEAAETAVKAKYAQNNV
jgi:hypothetical protein